MADGLDPFETYTSRTYDFAAGSQVRSADLNAIQDALILTSENLDAMGGYMLLNTTATANRSDSPAADTIGGRIVWFERKFTGTTVVVIDAAIDWRDRVVVITALNDTGAQDTATADVLPGGADDTDCAVLMRQSTEKSAVHGLFYTRSGRTPGGALDACLVVTGTQWKTGGTDSLVIFARASDGALCMEKTSNTDANPWLIGKAECSPMQNHY